MSLSSELCSFLYTICDPASDAASSRIAPTLMSLSLSLKTAYNTLVRFSFTTALPLHHCYLLLLQRLQHRAHPPRPPAYREAQGESPPVHSARPNKKFATSTRHSASRPYQHFHNLLPPPTFVGGRCSDEDVWMYEALEVSCRRVDLDIL